MTINTTNFANALRELYEDGLEELWYPKSPLLAWMPKSDDFKGKDCRITPIINGTRGSNGFSTALANVNNPSVQQFQVTRVKTYAFGAVDNETWDASDGDRVAQAKAIDTATKSAMYEFGRAAAHQAWGAGGGARGQIVSGATLSASSFTLRDTRDVVNFEVGMKLQCSADDGTGGGGVRVGTVEVSKVNRGSGLITLTGALNTGIPAVTDADYLFREGDYNTCLSGVLAWIPSTHPATGDSFFNVNRSTDASRLAGSRFAGNGRDIESVIFDAVAELDLVGGEADTLWMNPIRFADLTKSAHSQAWIDVATDRPTIGFRGFKFAGPMGDITVMADRNCPYAVGLLTKRSSWELKTLGGAPRYSENDGLKFRESQTDDATEFRMKAYWNVVNNNPMDSMHIRWDDASISTAS